jgi:hypothetical protein
MGGPAGSAESASSGVSLSGRRGPTPLHLFAWVRGVDTLSPPRVPGRATRTYSGRPRSGMRFGTPAAAATSVSRRPSVREHRPSPTTRFHRGMSASTGARRSRPEAFCRPMRPRSAMASMCRSRRVGMVSAVALTTAPERGGTMTAASGRRAATSAWTSPPSNAPSPATEATGPPTWSSGGPTREPSSASWSASADATIRPVSASVARCRSYGAAPGEEHHRRRTQADGDAPCHGRTT